MTNNTRIITCSTLRDQCDAINTDAAYLEPALQAKLAVRIAFLNQDQKTDLNLACHYCLSGHIAITVAILDPDHPMADLFTVRGAPVDVRAVKFVRDSLEKQSLQTQIEKLESMCF